MSEVEFEVLCEAWRVVERRGGAVYRTERIGEVWVPMGTEVDPTDPDVIYASLSTDRSRELAESNVNTIRRVRRGNREA